MRYHTAGYYSEKQKKLVFLEGNKKAFFHEIFHLLSSGGFLIGKQNLTIGTSLDEGFTSFLTQKYFYGKDAYIAESKFAEIIGYVIGYDKMGNYYFNHDLNSLINELSELPIIKQSLINPEEIIMNADYVCSEYRKMFEDKEFINGNIKKNNINININTSVYLKKISPLLKFINVIYADKLASDVINKNITYDEAILSFRNNIGILYNELLYRKNYLGTYYIDASKKNPNNVFLYFNNNLITLFEQYLNDRINTYQENHGFNK